MQRNQGQKEGITTCEEAYNVTETSSRGPNQNLGPAFLALCRHQVQQLQSSNGLVVAADKVVARSARVGDDTAEIARVGVEDDTVRAGRAASVAAGGQRVLLVGAAAVAAEVKALVVVVSVGVGGCSEARQCEC